MTSLRGVVWDLDGTLYAFNQHGFDMVARAAALAAVRMGLLDDYDEAEKIAWESGRRYRHMGTLFTEMFDVSKKDFHGPFHDAMDHEILEICSETAQIVAGLPVPQVILTHGSRPWAERVLERMGISHVFSPDQILPFEDVGYVEKHVGEAPFRAALDRLGLSASEAMMVEDSVPNLSIPHAMGMRTAYIHHGTPLQPQPDFVQAQFHGVPELARQVFGGCAPVNVDLGIKPRLG